MSKFSRDKGAKWERDVAIAFRDVWPTARRGLCQTRSAREASDVIGTPYWVECKVGKTITIGAAMRQAIDACERMTPIVVSKQDRCPPMVTMRLEDWLAMFPPCAPSERIPMEGIDDEC